MPRFFLALALPPATTAQLVTLQPSLMPGVRLISPDQMHLTLHFIGEMDEERATQLSDALGKVSIPRFPLIIEGVGRFPSAGGTTLWAGVCASHELQKLHSEAAQVMSGVGFQQEARPYHPHIALARCGPEVPLSLVNEFLARHHDFSLPGVSITGFGLYSSVFQGDVPLYSCVQQFS